MSLLEQLSADLADAMRQREELRRDVLRMALSAVHNAEIAGGDTLDDPGVLAVLSKEAKQRRESIEEYRKADRGDLVEREEAELVIIAAYLPQQLSRDEIAEAVRKVIDETGASGPQDIGKVMSPIMQQLKGKADGREVNEVVRELLADA